MGFSSNKKTKKPKLADATDFLNPADMSITSEGKGQETIVQGSNNEVKIDKKVDKKRLKEQKKLAKKRAKELKKRKKEEAKLLKSESVKKPVIKDKKVANNSNGKKEIKAKKEDKKLKKAAKPQKGIDRMDLANPKVLEINLIKDQISVFFDWYKNLALLIVFVFLSFLLVGEIYLALAWWQDRSQGQVDYSNDSFITLNQEIRDIKDKADEALAFKGKLSQVNYLLDNHIYWSNMFDYLEGVTMDEVKYDGFGGDISGFYTLFATTESFPDIGRQVQKFLENENTLLVKVNSGDAIKEEDIVSGVSFSIRLELNTEIFKK